MGANLIDADVVTTVITHNERFVLAPELVGAVFRKKVSGDPMRWTGSRAIVFCADLPNGGALAVRIPKQHEEPAAQRYAALDDHLRSCGDAPLVRTRWHDQGVELPGGGNHPLVTLEWIDGQALDRYVDHLVRGPGAQAHLAGLAGLWLDTTSRVGLNQIAHGDIHAGNVMVTADSGGRAAIKLVDYDCVWVPGLMVGRTEVGLASFQHPAGSPEWGPHMDGFSNTLVYLSLIGLAADPTLWRFYRADDRLIFHVDDLKAPARSEIFTALTASPAQAVQGLADAVARWCGGAPDAHASLAAILHLVSSDRPPRQQGRQVWNAAAATPIAAARSTQQVWPALEPAAPAKPAAPGRPPPPPASTNQSWPSPELKPTEAPGAPGPPHVNPRRSLQDLMADPPIWLIVAIVIFVLILVAAVGQ